MLQHDFITGKFYYNGIEVSESEYNDKYTEWKNSLPPESTEEPDLNDSELLNIILGGGTE